MKAETVTAVAVSASTSLVAGTFIGMPILALILGLCGGIVALSWAEPAAWWRLLLTLVAATLAGGALGPLVAAHIHAETVDPRIELVAASLLCGAGFQAILQAGVGAAVNRLRQIGGTTGGPQP